MRKILLIGITILASGFISSCTKDSSVKPAATVKTSDALSGTGSADGTPPQ